eukprot:SM000259S08736  [mRNA]  locus=s259:65456:69273:+ [translate_table: standard]
MKHSAACPVCKLLAAKRGECHCPRSLARHPSPPAVAHCRSLLPLGQRTSSAQHGCLLVGAEVRRAPSMDAMVAAYRQMEASSGLHICCTQPPADVAEKPCSPIPNAGSLRAAGAAKGGASGEPDALPRAAAPADVGTQTPAITEGKPAALQQGLAASPPVQTRLNLDEIEDDELPAAEAAAALGARSTKRKAERVAPSDTAWALHPCSAEKTGGRGPPTTARGDADKLPALFWLRETDELCRDEADEGGSPVAHAAAQGLQTPATPLPAFSDLWDPGEMDEGGEVIKGEEEAPAQLTPDRPVVVQRKRSASSTVRRRSCKSAMAEVLDRAPEPVHEPPATIAGHVKGWLAGFIGARSPSRAAGKNDNDRASPLASARAESERPPEPGHTADTHEAEAQSVEKHKWPLQQPEECAASDDDAVVEALTSGPLCAFCGKAGDSEVAGALEQVGLDGGLIERGEASVPNRRRIQLAGVHVHEFCLEWYVPLVGPARYMPIPKRPDFDAKSLHSHTLSRALLDLWVCRCRAPNVYFEGDLVKNLKEELARAHRLRCSKCGERGAPLGCALAKCRRSYHYACAASIPACTFDNENFVMRCPDHAERRKGHRNALMKAARPSGRPAAAIVREPAVWSSGVSQQWAQLAAFAATVGATLAKDWTASVTHVITGTDADGRAKRTLKYLTAILNGRWIVSLNWLDACTAAGRPVKEGPFELRKDIHDMVGGPRQGRTSSKKGKLFSHLSVHFVGDFQAPSKADLATVVFQGGGEVLQRRPIPSTGSESKERGVVILFPAGGPQAEARAMADACGAWVLPHTWLLDSAAACQLLPKVAP